jgi:biopolymer transport protein ExbD
MAEVSIAVPPADKKQRHSKRSTRVDLTPMVDLGFLLITFFIFTTSMSEPRSLKLRLPADAVHGEPSTTAESNTLNVLPWADHKVFYFMGNNIQDMRATDYSNHGIRQVIMDARNKVGKSTGNGKDLVILIKATPESDYQQLVTLLNEMIINDITRYYLTEPAANETGFLRQQEAKVSR